VVNAVQVWSPDDWEAFAHHLLRIRHGALHVHKIPAAHKGDLGIDYYCTEPAVAYQCYSVEEPIDIGVRAERQKKKITTDLGKIVKNTTILNKLFLGNPIKHWILLAPLHDSKDVNLHCSKKTTDLRSKKLAHLDDGFEVGIHDTSCFTEAAVATGISALATVALSVPVPTPEEMDQWTAGSPDLLANANHKLAKRTGPTEVQRAVALIVKSFLEGEALVDALRTASPDLHERIMEAIASRSRRLEFAGPHGGPSPGGILDTEIESLVSAIKAAVPSLSNRNAEQIAYGAVSEWVMRCPLDFPPYA
jgi:hypothetical protein